MVADVVEEDTEIVQDLEAAEADMEDQGQLIPRLLLSLEMNKPVRLRNFCILTFISLRFPNWIFGETCFENVFAPKFILLVF